MILMCDINLGLIVSWSHRCDLIFRKKGWLACFLRFSGFFRLLGKVYRCMIQDLLSYRSTRWLMRSVSFDSDFIRRHRLLLRIGAFNIVTVPLGVKDLGEVVLVLSLAHGVERGELHDVHRGLLGDNRRW